MGMACPMMRMMEYYDKNYSQLKDYFISANSFSGWLNFRKLLKLGVEKGTKTKKFLNALIEARKKQLKIVI